MTASDFEEKGFMLGTIFKPASPVNREDLFAGRSRQVRDVVDVTNQPGLHAVLYGERGVGKTSLANVILLKLRNPSSEIIAPQINCMTHDSYSDIWKRVFEEIDFKAKQKHVDLVKSAKKILAEYTGPFSDAITPDIVRRVLYTLGQEKIIIVTLDEFDTLERDDARAMMSDTIKFLSDRVVPATIIIIGVADDAESLIKNHRSLERCLKQILMQRMSDKEIEIIVTQGLGKAGMTIGQNAVDEIARLSRGLPHYAHLLGLYSGRVAIDNRKLAVSNEHVQTAITRAIGEAQATIKSDYSKATTSSRQEALYKHVLLACAIAETDDVGWFYPKDVRKPLGRILGRPYKIEAFARHLHAFCEETRGTMLIKDESSARPRFRFDNPLLQPYILIRGIADNLISTEDLRSMKDDPRQPQLF
jgi:Cdc6-like AAA superfamily ATPase